MHIESLDQWKHDHDFNIDTSQGEKRTRLVVLLTACMMVIEITAGYVFGSMALLADGWHMGTHVAALAISLLEVRGFTADDFARSHPGGKLGRRLLLLIDDLLHTGERVPKVPSGTLICDVLLEMTQKGLGTTAIVDEKDIVLGIFTDGDLRRALDHDIDLHKTPIDQVMTRNPTLISPGLLAAEALQIMDAGKFNALLVVDADRRLIGALNMHDLLRAGVV